MIKDLSSSYSKMKHTKQRISYMRGSIQFSLSNEDSNAIEDERKQELVQVGTKQEREAFRAEMYLNAVNDESLTKFCYRCGKKFIPKPWRADNLSFYLCDDCKKKEEAKATQLTSSEQIASKWNFAERDKTQQILDLFNRSY